jgi:hypothetical protein
MVGRRGRKDSRVKNGDPKTKANRKEWKALIHKLNPQWELC